MKSKLPAASLLSCSAAVILGFILEINTYWFITDIAVIITCAVNGILLLKKSSCECAQQ